MGTSRRRYYEVLVGFSHLDRGPGLVERIDRLHVTRIRYALPPQGVWDLKRPSRVSKGARRRTQGTGSVQAGNRRTRSSRSLDLADH